MGVVQNISKDRLVFQTANTNVSRRQARPAPVNPLLSPPDPRLMEAFDARTCYAHGVLPWRRVGGQTVVLSADLALPQGIKQRLEKTFGQIRIGFATERQILTALLDKHGADLAAEAEQLCPQRHSCRGWNAPRFRTLVITVSLGFGAALAVWPSTTLFVLTAWLTFALFCNTALKVIGLCFGPQTNRPETAPNSAILARLPLISLMVPLYREPDVANHIIARIDQLDYPRERLDLCLIVEDDDAQTRAAIESSVIPAWVQIIEVPEGTIRTKPRALNFALSRAKGSIIGIYDAEDIPAKDQLRKVVHHFAQRGPEVACLQGALDYFNPSSNWLSRCFTLEYATWFRLILPTLEGLRCVIPLGGTTVFLRRDAIEQVGGWDAHNVTEDADLGIRLARAGFRTEVIDSVTMEEANARPWRWIRQRSRWLKGYAMTWAVHMRNPWRLLRDLGPWQFFGVQMHFFGTLSAIALAPLLWSCWLISLGAAHPLQSVLAPGAVTCLVALFILSEAISLAAAAVAVKRTGRPWLIPWAMTLPLYYLMATAAVYKALFEMMVRPFYWDKTDHGHDMLLDLSPATAPMAPMPRHGPHPIAAE